MSDVFFALRLRTFGQQIALISETGARLTYVQLADAVDAQAAALPSTRQLVIVETENTVECVVAYLACLQAGHPVILSEAGSVAADPRIANLYGAAWVFRCSAGRWQFEQLDTTAPAPLHADLSILLSTSGSTGSPKLVRLSRDNVHANAASIASYLGLTGADRAVTSLPLHYSFGMSVLNSHLHAGAAVLLASSSVSTPEFWDFFSAEGATSLSGVPFTFELLERVGFRSRTYPALRYLAQAGGRLAPERVRAYAQWAQESGKQMFVMYGQTEASPRMAYVPPEMLLDNVDAIGVPVPGGSFELRDEEGGLIAEPNVQGELVYRGANVMMGYARSADDLATGIETLALHTGDLACRKPNGCYVITGRMSRFSKIVGLRISLDEIERWLSDAGLQGMVSGDDRAIVVALAGVGAPAAASVKQRLAQRFLLPASAFVVLALEALPTLSSGKFDYRTVLLLGHAALDVPTYAPDSLLSAYREVLGNADVRPGDSFLDLGGDSINFVEIALLLESYLGVLPENWEASSIAALEALKVARPEATVPSEALSALTPGKNKARKKERGGILQAALVAIALLVAGEAILQARSYLKTGRSAVNMATGDSRVMKNERFGMKTYRPNISDGDRTDDLEFTTNGLGFRSPSIAPVPAPGELRIAVVGASTVAGAYAKTNSATFPQLLEERLRRAMPGRVVNVINAGIEGYTVRDMERLIERAIIPQRPNIVIIYPGFNDMAALCRPGTRASAVLQPVAAPSLPQWVLTREVISKNTLALREAPARIKVDLKARFPTFYRHSLDGMVNKLNAAGIKPILLTVARAFRPNDGEAGRRLAKSSLFYNSCLDYDSLNEAGTMFNQTIANVARSRATPLIDLGRMMPSGPAHFVDSSHFTRAGEELSSEIIYRELVNEMAIVKRHLIARK